MIDQANDYHFVGMHLFWWVIWLLLILWIFALPYKIPGQRSARESPLDILKKRLALGDITKEEFHDKKKIIEG